MGEHRGLAFVVLLAVGGCADPYDHRIPKGTDSLDGAPELRAAVHDLPPADQAVVARYLEMGFAHEKAVTVREALTQVRQLDGQIAIENARRNKLAAALRVKLQKLEPIQGGWNVEISVTNTSGRDIAALRGRLEFENRFGDRGGDVQIRVEERLAVGAERKFVAFRDFVGNIPDGNVRAIWSAETIVFSDGTRLD